MYRGTVRQRDRGASARHAALLVGTLAIVLGTLLSSPAAAPVRAGEPTDLLPDLRAARPNEMRIVSSNGRRLLRFTALMSNRGDGPMEVRARRDSVDDPWRVRQRIYDTTGTFRFIDTEASLRFSGDGHNHWHVERMMVYHLFSPQGTRQDRKIGFCFFDTNRVAPNLAGSPATAFYRESWCGGRTALESRTGISVGWGDKYGWNLAYQWIDITGLPGGTYTIRAMVDPEEVFLETDESNNCAWGRISIPSSGTNVQVVSSGSACRNDYQDTMYEPYVQWAYTEAVTGGCGFDMFCTGNSVTRAQVASFIARVLDLPYPDEGEDYFDDDDGKTHETDINRLAKAGITGGCGERTYCYADPVTRAQMASLLVRAFDLPPAVETDRFTDDDGNTHEADIDALAEVRVTGGCGPQIYCPRDPVTRGQMVAFMYRALAYEPPPTE